MTASRGKQALKCTQCGREFAKLKCKVKYPRDEGHVCMNCYNKERGRIVTPAAASTPPPAQLSTPRRALSAPLHLTPEHITHLRSTVKEAGLGQQGRTRSAPETARAILHVSAMMNLRAQLPSSVQRVLTFDKAVKATATAEMMSPTILRQSIKRYEKENVLTPPEPKRLKRDHPLHLLFGELGPPLAVESEIYQRVDEARQQICSSPSVRSVLMFCR